MLVSAVVFLVKIYVQCGLVDAVLLLYRFFIRFHKIEPVKDAIGQDEARKELKLCRCVVFHTSKVRSFDTQTYLQVYVYVTLCHGSLQVSLSESLNIPPLTDIRELIAASAEIEKCEENNMLPDRKWIAQLVQPGTSLGGARPKANVVDADKTLYVAKFPSRKDDYDVGLWEHFSHLLATKAGVNVAQTKVLATGEKYHTLLSRRFDRASDGKRIHFASAMSLLGLSDGDNATSGHGYLDIVDFIIQNCTDVERNLQELYRRVAFNICIGNSDDHFRNHGFLLTAKGWTLSPAYDMNPTLNEYQSLLISSISNKADLRVLLDACEDYMLNRKTAEKIVSEVVEAVKEWSEIAIRQCVSKREIDMFSGVLDKRYDSI